MAPSPRDATGPGLPTPRRARGETRRASCGPLALRGHAAQTVALGSCRRASSSVFTDLKSVQRGEELEADVLSCENRLHELQRGVRRLAAEFASLHFGGESLLKDLEEIVGDTLEASCSDRLAGAMDSFETSMGLVGAVGEVLRCCVSVGKIIEDATFQWTQSGHAEEVTAPSLPTTPPWSYRAEAHGAELPAAAGFARRESRDSGEQARRRRRQSRRFSRGPPATACTASPPPAEEIGASKPPTISRLPLVELPGAAGAGASAGAVAGAGVVAGSSASSPSASSDATSQRSVVESFYIGGEDEDEAQKLAIEQNSEADEVIDVEPQSPQTNFFWDELDWEAVVLVGEALATKPPPSPLPHLAARHADAADSGADGDGEGAGEALPADAQKPSSAAAAADADAAVEEGPLQSLAESGSRLRELLGELHSQL